MSRRRSAWGSRDDVVRLYIECDGRESHDVYRIARVQITPRPDLPDLNGGYAVGVEYVHEADDPEYSSRTNPVRGAVGGAHMTRVFPCRECRWDKPLKDSSLVPIALRLSTMGVRQVRLRELP